MHARSVGLHGLLCSKIAGTYVHLTIFVRERALGQFAQRYGPFGHPPLLSTESNTALILSTESITLIRQPIDQSKGPQVRLKTDAAPQPHNSSARGAPHQLLRAAAASKTKDRADEAMFNHRRRRHNPKDGTSLSRRKSRRPFDGYVCRRTYS